MRKRQKIRKGIILISFFLFPATFYYLSPVLILEASSQAVINGSFIIFLSLFVSSLILGRAFCGWACPAAGCQESISAVRSRKVTTGNFIKWIIWIPWISTIVILVTRVGGYNSIDFFFQTTHGLSIGNFQSLIVYLFVLLLLIVMPAFVIGKRSFCHHLCWMAPFMIIGRKIRNLFGWSSLRIIARSENCLQCHTCTSNCPMSLPVEEMVKQNKMENSECILCGTCVDVCSQGTISYHFGKI